MLSSTDLQSKHITVHIVIFSLSLSLQTFYFTNLEHDFFTYLIEILTHEISLTFAFNPSYTERLIMHAAQCI